MLRSSSLVGIGMYSTSLRAVGVDMTNRPSMTKAGWMLSGLMGAFCPGCVDCGSGFAIGRGYEWLSEIGFWLGAALSQNPVSEMDLEESTNS